MKIKGKTYILFDREISENWRINVGQFLSSSIEMFRCCYSSSRSSPPSSTGEICTRISSESDIGRDSFRASIPRTYHFKTDANALPTRQSPVLNGIHLPADIKNNFSVPIFVLHAKGSFYVPLTIDYYTLLPFLQNYNLLEMFPNIHNVVLHPVTINVNFQPNGGVKYKTELVHNTWH